MLKIGSEFELHPYEHGWKLIQNVMQRTRVKGVRGGEYLRDSNGEYILAERPVIVGYYHDLRSAASKIIDLLARGKAFVDDCDIGDLVRAIDDSSARLSRELRRAAGGK